MSDNSSFFPNSERNKKIPTWGPSNGSNSLSEIVRDSGKGKEIEFEKNSNSFKDNTPKNMNSLLGTKQHFSTKDVFLICGIGLLEPYKKFINLNLDKINDENPSQTQAQGNGEEEKKAFAD